MTEPIRFEVGVTYRTFSGVRYTCTHRSEKYVTLQRADAEQQRKMIHVMHDATKEREVEQASPHGKIVMASDRADTKRRQMTRKPKIVTRADETYEIRGGTYRKVAVGPDGRTIRGAHLAQPANKKERRKARRGEAYRSRSGAVLQMVDGQIREIDG